MQVNTLFAAYNFIKKKGKETDDSDTEFTA